MTKCLFLTCSHDDYLSACLWDGLQEVLGEKNVYDAGYSTNLHSSTADGVTARVGGSRPGRCLTDYDRDFDLLVINVAYLRDHDWHSVVRFREHRCRPNAKVAYVEGNDNWWEVNGTPFTPTAVFRREMVPGGAYNYGCPVYSLLMAAPIRWFAGSDNPNRGYDVFAAVPYGSNDLRWQALPKIFQTRSRHNSIAASTGVSHDRYFDYMRASKLTLCPPGGGSDCLRQWEAIACGSIPLFCGHGERVRENWFTPDMIFEFGDINLLPETIDHALSLDLRPRREAMIAHALKYHTTAARARRLLEGVGIDLDELERQRT